MSEARAFRARGKRGSDPGLAPGPAPDERHGRAHVREVRREMEARLVELATSIDRLHADQGFAALLKGTSRLWRYGSFNQWLIYRDCRHATAVAGRRKWESLGRTVREGEQPIQILAYRDGPRGGWPFIVVEVFDISQTDGPPLPPPESFRNPKGDYPRLPEVEAAARRLRIKLEYVPAFPEGWSSDTPVLGLAHTRKRKVQVRESLTPLEKARVLAHEYAHVLLHQPYRRVKGKKVFEWPEHAIAEAEADAAAYVVLEALGLPSAIPTYIAWMGGRSSMLVASMKRIQVAARAILLAIEGEKPIVRMPRLPPKEKKKRPPRPPGPPRRRKART